MRFSLIVLAALAIFFAPNFLRADWSGGAEAASEAVAAEQPRLVAATFRSSWCGACRIIEPRIEDVQEEYRDAEINFLRFDSTLGRRDSLREMAEAEGIAALYDDLEGATGFMVLMDRESGQVIEIITRRYSRENIRQAIERGLAYIAEQESAA